MNYNSFHYVHASDVKFISTFLAQEELFCPLIFLSANTSEDGNLFSEHSLTFIFLKMKIQKELLQFYVLELSYFDKASSFSHKEIDME